MSSPIKQPIVLRVHKNGALVGVKQFLDNQIVMGRQSDLQLPLEGDSVAVIHCAIENRDGAWFIADLGSESGTKKNQETILDSAIQSGDTIEVGEYKIEFFIGIPKPKAPPVETAVPSVTTPPPSTPLMVSTPPLTRAPLFPPLGTNSREQAVVPESRPAKPAEFSRPIDRPTVDIISGSGNLETVAARPIRASVRPHGHKKKGRKTFAPPSRYQNVKEFVKPTKGSVVEVMVAWRERVIATYSFSEKKIVTIGSKPSCDVPVPVMGSRLRSAPIVKVDQPATVFILPESTGELVRGQNSQPFSELSRTGRIGRSGELSTLVLEQGELVKMDVGEGISIIIRYVSEAPKPLMAPLFDLTTSEITGVVLAMALVAVLSLYMYLYSPTKELPPEAGLDEPLRTAVMLVKPTPIPPPLPPVEQTKVVEIPATPVPTPPPQVVRSTPSPVKTEIKQKQTQAQVLTQVKTNPGQAANAAANKNKTGPRTQTSVKQGGAIKTTDQKASQMQSKPKDVSKAGIFSTFGGGGAQNTLAGSTTGSGELAGLSASATGRSGFNENRTGEGLGSATKDTGQGGTGKSLEGIVGGIKTEGRGGGNAGYGTGGLGGRVGVKVIPGGEGEAFSGTIDREAIRRVILANYRVIKTCYEKELNRTPDLVGKLVIEWDIGEKGAVLRTAVQRNELGNKAVADCLMGRLRMWRFPEPPTNEVVTVAYPFVFSN
ncbi:MAG: AgmX/PglI C-terminal domain-containing protein [Deltaproteobacteria bacterium]|nr:AgmX/PglI C-terminal domain-containing protein [Deltaproteobacteria bacterium]